MAKHIAKLSVKLPAFTAHDALPEERMHWVQVPFADIKALYDAGALRVQRNHLRRLASAQHVLSTNLPLHANFMAVRLPDDTVWLADGYTRVAAIEADMREEPAAPVWLGVVDVDSMKDGEQIYLAVDSRRAVKTGRDTFEEGMRKAGLLGKLHSPLFTGGAVVSALYAASGEKDPLVSVPRFKKAFERLDSLGLGGGRAALPAGALGACLLLAQHEEDAEAVLQFTAALASTDKLESAEKKLVPGALKAAAWLDERREAGALSGKNVPVILAQVLGSFVWQQEGASGRVTPLSRDEYLQR